MARERQIVTVFTDASFCPRTKASGFAVWIKTKSVTLRHSGAFKVAINTPGEAETAALSNGICAAMTRLDLQAGDIIVAASDCLDAIRAVEGKAKRLKPTMAMICDHVRQGASVRGVDVRLKRVRAHQGKDAGPRHAVNEWCDKAAKAVMRDARSAKTANLAAR